MSIDVVFARLKERRRKRKKKEKEIRKERTKEKNKEKEIIKKKKMKETLNVCVRAGCGSEIFRHKQPGVQNAI